MITVEPMGDDYARVIKNGRELGTVQRMTLNYQPAPGQMASRERWVPVGPEAAALSKDALVGVSGAGFADRAGAVGHLIHRGDTPPARVAPGRTRKNSFGQTRFGLSVKHRAANASCTCKWQWTDADGNTLGDPGMVLQAAREHDTWEHTTGAFKHVDITAMLDADARAAAKTA